MMQLLYLLTFVGVMAASREFHLRTNRISALPSWNSTCDECQTLVHRFHEALKDPVKMNELKALMRVLCHETSYVEECREFVNHLDEIIKMLDPYLSDAKAVCRYLHLCSKRMSQFHRLALLYTKWSRGIKSGTNDIVCDECQFAATELRQVVSDKTLQQEARDFLRTQVCGRFGKYRGDCDMVIEQFLPEFFQELEAALANPKKVCQEIGFCGNSRRNLGGFLGYLQEL
ncbi:unnamed protein product, partial [Mesorhabditis belari]|uniref:Saposin B-type domain-containing protein n=1 Tax=Mesorhabditis belari TaxID=2138241 RepID=A0AAF3FHN8_9BILA